MGFSQEHSDGQFGNANRINIQAARKQIEIYHLHATSTYLGGQLPKRFDVVGLPVFFKGKEPRSLVVHKWNASEITGDLRAANPRNLLQGLAKMSNPVFIPYVPD